MEDISCPLCRENMIICERISWDKHIGIKNDSKLKGVINLYTCNKGGHITQPLQYITINNQKFGPFLFISKGIIFIDYDNGKKTFAFIYKDWDGYFVKINDKKYGPYTRYPFLVYNNGFFIMKPYKTNFNYIYPDNASNCYDLKYMAYVEFGERIKEAQDAYKKNRKVNKYLSEWNNAYKLYWETNDGNCEKSYEIYCEFVEFMKNAEDGYMQHGIVKKYIDELWAAYKKYLKEMKNIFLEEEMEMAEIDLFEDRYYEDEYDYEHSQDGVYDVVNDYDEENPYYED